MKKIPVKPGEAVELRRDLDGKIIGLAKQPEVETEIVGDQIVIRLRRRVYLVERQCRREEGPCPKDSSTT